MNRITLVGAGNLGQALATLLPKAGYKVDEIVIRTGSLHARKAVHAARQANAHLTTTDDAKYSAPIIWLAVGDSAIPSCAKELAERITWKNKIVLHSSGALSSDVLAPLRSRGASVGSAHPMMSFVAGQVPSLERVAWALEGDAKAVAAAKGIVRNLGGRALEIKKKDKPLYHAFGAFLSPLLVVHLEIASQLAMRAGIPRKRVAEFMAPILARTLENLLTHIGKSGASGKAFSGPLVRGDVGTVKKHIESLKGTGAETLYRALVEAAVSSDLPIQNRAAIRKLLRSRQ